jgi:hypothetical protein
MPLKIQIFKQCCQPYRLEINHYDVFDVHPNKYSTFVSIMSSHAKMKIFEKYPLAKCRTTSGNLLGRRILQLAVLIVPCCHFPKICFTFLDNQTVQTGAFDKKISFYRVPMDF